MKRYFIVFILPLMLSACTLQKRPIPENVSIVLEKAEANRSELEKVLDAYQSAEDAEKYNAACFLIGNMSDKCYANFEVSDSSNNIIGFSALDYPDYNAMTRAWDSIVRIRGKLHQQRIDLVYDYEIISSDYLINNIERAFHVWKSNSWTKSLNFEQFCEYILPYRSTNEPLEEWREYFEQEYAWLKDSLKNESDPVEACKWINNNIKSWFSFDPRFYEHATDLGMTEMVNGKMGRCEDMTNLAIYAMRANGIPVMSDFTPYWAKSGNNHAWNAVMGADGKIVIFMGGESNPGDYKLRQAKAKVYRKTFALQAETLAAILEKEEKAPAYINRNGIVDVTPEYVPVSDVQLQLDKSTPDDTRFAYICVFNTGEWKAIHWSFISEGGNVKFTDMGTDIAYLPAYYINEKIIPAGKQFILTAEGEIAENNANYEKPVTLKLTSTTKRVTTETTDFAEKVFLIKGESYELFYWNDKWISLGVQKASGNPLIFKNVPSGAMYWLTNTTPTKDRPERIFTINDEEKQIWW
ncbi:MAG: transglutaminase-like domain-containing protein [Bacteroidota bacterium]